MARGSIHMARSPPSRRSALVVAGRDYVRINMLPVPSVADRPPSSAFSYRQRVSFRFYIPFGV